MHRAGDLIRKRRESREQKGSLLQSPRATRKVTASHIITMNMTKSVRENVILELSVLFFDHVDGFPDSGAKNSSTGESKGLIEPSSDRGERGQSRGGARGSNSSVAGNDSGVGIAIGAGSSSEPGLSLGGEISR